MTFAARPQNHEQKLNKKMYRAALRSILAELVRSERLVVVEDFAVDAPKTKALASKLNGMGLSDVLIVSDAVDQNLYRLRAICRMSMYVTSRVPIRSA